MSRRTERIAHLIRGIVAEGILTRLSDPRISKLTSVTRIELSPDLSYAHVHVSIMGQPNKQKLGLQALQHAAGHLRSMVAEQVSIRQVPWLTFHLDESVRRGSEMVETLDRLMREAGQTPSMSWEEPTDDDEHDVDGDDASTEEGAEPGCPQPGSSPGKPG